MTGKLTNLEIANDYYVPMELLKMSEFLLQKTYNSGIYKKKSIIKNTLSYLSGTIKAI